MRIRWSDQARRDLLEIAAWIARDRPGTARAVMAKLRASVERLRAHPHLGRVVPEIGAEQLRERVVAPWRVIYRVQGDTIQIVTVLHGRRQVSED